MVTFDTLIEKISKYLPDMNRERIRNAFDFASEAHMGQKRYSGEDYIVHPLMTAYYLADFQPDEDTLVSALLHDVSEDTPRTIEEIEKYFGKTVANLVGAMEKVGRVRARLDETQAENLQKMFLSMAKDARVVLIKLCDRLHNIETLRFVPKEKQMRIARETLEIYAPIASCLGIYRLKIALEDNAFRFTHPEEAGSIEQDLKSTKKYREEYMADAKQALFNLLSAEGQQCTVDGRIKSLFSIYSKMKRKKKTSLSEIFDIFAMRVLLSDVWKYDREYVGHIYSALGIIHSNFTPLAHRFKDYVAIPKVNGYRSLHTTVMGLGKKTHKDPTEIQIRSKLMHRQAEFGIASHWLYEISKGESVLIPAESVLTKRINWLHGLSNLRETLSNKDEYFEQLQVDVFQDRIFVFTPRGEVKDLPRGATPVDFAYAVHSDIGNKCVLAKVNGNAVPLNYELKNGEVIEIVTKQNATPSQNWLAFVKTNHARNRIRYWFRDMDRAKNLKAGKELVNAYLMKIGRPVLTPDLLLLRKYSGQRLTYAQREDLLVEVGRGTLLTSSLIKGIFSFEDIIADWSKPTLRKERLSKSKKISEKDEKQHVVIGGQVGLPYNFAKCCKASGSDDIMGLVTRGGIITVHKKMCSAFKGSNISRHQKIVLMREKEGQCRIKVVVDVIDRIGLIRDIGNLMARLGINIMDIFLNRDKSGSIIQLKLDLEVRNFDQLEKVLQALEFIPDIKKACLVR